jgi:hypothetical protein
MMRRGFFVALVALVVLVVASPASAGVGLNAYRANAKGLKQLRELKRLGFDLTEGQRRKGVEIVATKAQIRKLRRAGVRTKLLRTKRGRTALKASAAQAAGGYQVWRPYSRTDVAVSGAAGNPTANIRTQIERIAQQNPGIVKLETIGQSLRGQPIYALKVTKNARQTNDGSRPAVLYSAVQHAREWLAGETERRTLRMFVDNYGKSGTAVGTDGQPIAGVSSSELTDLVNTRELWFIIIANPDGYDFTFDPENRLWRKNLRDNNGDGKITAVDGVDPNRNFPTRWNYDDEGSNTDTASETYRGTGPASEPETKAFLSLMNRVHFTYNKNDHTAAELLLWPFGWQVDTHPADEPLMTALAGDDANPGIPTFDPDVGADLYTTNGDTNDHMYKTTKTISYTPEGTAAATGSVFVFQDNEADVQAEFERHVQFALDLARSAPDPTHPKSHLTGFDPPNFVVDKFAVSYGSPQTVQVNTRRDLGPIEAHWQVNGGATHTISTTEWNGGLRYGDEGDYWYHRMRAQVGGNAGPGDNVKVWFSAPNKNEQSGSFTYNVRSNSGADVLVLAVEDYTGQSELPAYNQHKKPNYLSYYTNALADNGVKYDVYDFDAMGRKAPDPLGVLSHYDAVIWETGNDNVTRNTATPGVSDAEAWENIMAVRDFVNEGGRVAVAGVNAGRQWDLVEYPTEGLPNSTCDGDLQTTDGGKCNPLSNDFAQYYLGAYLRSDAGGQDPAGNIFPVEGTPGGPLDGLTFDLNGAGSARNQGGSGLGTGNFLVTSSILPKSQYPQFASDQAADWKLSGGAPFEPHTGSKYMFSQYSDAGYKRMTRTVDLTGVTGTQPANLSFWTSFNTETDWDFVFVEAHTVGQDDYTTLPDANGHTSQNTGSSCPEEWGQELHPILQHYQTVHENGPGNDDNTCDPTGTTGSWNASTGNSAGWQNWSIDLSAYRGKQVEISIVFATDWGTRVVPGMMVDDTTVTAGSNVSQTSFETQGDLGGWTIPGPHAGSPSENVDDWIQSDKIPIEDAAVTVTRFGMMFGFGLEGVNGAGNRAVLMDRILDHLLQ